MVVQTLVHLRQVAEKHEREQERGDGSGCLSVQLSSIAGSKERRGEYTWGVRSPLDLKVATGQRHGRAAFGAALEHRRHEQRASARPCMVRPRPRTFSACA
eukprot:6187498-Pleurochrysis_carterae.AAC.5